MTIFINTKVTTSTMPIEPRRPKPAQRLTFAERDRLNERIQRQSLYQNREMRERLAHLLTLPREELLKIADDLAQKGAIRHKLYQMYEKNNLAIEIEQAERNNRFKQKGLL
ncbi:MAG: hypothetical protein NTY48_06190 [Candidatus Diapherotrites archaeon]|nr:hypothetical protein [Candidatus Diapherotrites archaeon]